MIGDPSCKVDEKFHTVLVKGCLQLRQQLKSSRGSPCSIPPLRDLFRVARRGPSDRLGRLRTREIATRLQTGSREEQDALAALIVDLENVGIRIGCDEGTAGTRRDPEELERMKS